MSAVHKPFDHEDTFSAGIFAEEEAKEEAERKARQKEQILNAAVVSVMGTESGRLFVDWLLELSGVEESVTASNDRAMLYASAQRDIGLHIRDTVKSACPALYELMEKESDERSSRSDGNG